MRQNDKTTYRLSQEFYHSIVERHHERVRRIGRLFESDAHLSEEEFATFLNSEELSNAQKAEMWAKRMNVTYHRSEADEREFLQLANILRKQPDHMKLLAAAWLSYRSIFKARDLQLVGRLEEMCSELAQDREWQNFMRDTRRHTLL